MKKSLILFAAAGLLLGTSACEKNFDPVISGVLTPDKFPSNEADFELYTLTAYKPFGSKWGYSEQSYQNMFFSPEYGHHLMFDISGDDFSVYTEWGGQFEGFSKGDFSFLRTQGRASHFEKVRHVSRMTQTIADLQKAKISETKKKQLIAEASMSRGMTMFYLLHMYGPVPVITDPAKINTPAESDLTRPARASYVSAVEADLDYAAANLPKVPSQYGRFNKGLALGVLMRLHLNEKNWPKAEKAGRELLTLGYSLVKDYASLFRTPTERNSETIWAVSCDAGADGNPLQGNFNPWSYYCLPNDYKGIRTGGGWGPKVGVFTPTWDFYDSFDSTDIRRTLMVKSYKDGARNRTNMRGPVLVKYPDEDSPQYQGNDLVILRYADVLLMLAEAINNQAGPTAEAVDLMNQVRKRAGIANLSAADAATKDAFNTAVLRERSWELYFEGLRKMDLVRHGKWESALKAAGKIPGPSPYFPVPQYVLDLNEGLEQTPGY